MVMKKILSHESIFSTLIALVANGHKHHWTEKDEKRSSLSTDCDFISSKPTGPYGKQFQGGQKKWSKVILNKEADRTITLSEFFHTYIDSRQYFYYK